MMDYFEIVESPATARFADAVETYLAEMDEIRRVSRHGEQMFAD